MKKAILAAAIAALVGCSDSATETTSTDTTSNTDTSEAINEDTEAVDTETDTSDDSESSDDNEETGSGDTTEPPSVSCTPTDVGIAFQASSATLISDADHGPDQLFDGCIDRENSWSGDKGTIVTLDAGEVHQMQGVYIWSTFARMEWLRIESSADGLSWVTDWHAMPTKPITGPVYYPLAEAGSKRYIRITGYGSDFNDWTNIAEVRWSVTGYSVQGDKVTRTADHASFGDSPQAFDALTAQLFNTSAFPYEKCGVAHGVLVDATGSLGQFHTVAVVNGLNQHLIDWDHYPIGVFQGASSHPETFYMIDEAAEYALANTSTQESTCYTSGLRDSLWPIDELVTEARGL